MRKSYLTAVLGILMAVSLAGNVYLLYRSANAFPYAQTATLDNLLVGTWISKDLHGYRLILLRSGEFVVTNYGTPYGPAGRWKAANGELELRWAIDEDDLEGNPITASYSLAEHNQELVLSRGFLPDDVKVFVRASGRP